VLILVQFPLVDARRFLPDATGPLRRPTWPTPRPLPEARRAPKASGGVSPNAAIAAPLATPAESPEIAPPRVPGAVVKVEYDFIRSFGAVRRRRLGPITGWKGESLYCDLRNLVRFHRSIPEVAYRGPNGSALAITGVHRRFYNDGRAMGRFEIGFKFEWFSSTRGESFAEDEMPPEAVGQILRFVLESPMSIADHYSPNADAVSKRKVIRHEMQLADAGPSFASAFLFASTKDLPANPADHSWWVRVGSPVLFVAYAPHELQRLPVGASPLNIFGTSAPADGAQQSAGAAAPDSRPIIHLDKHLLNRESAPRVWYISQGSHSPTARDFARRARVHLMRFASETEGATGIIRLIQLGKIPLVRSKEENDPSDRLQRYLGDAIKFLRRKVGAGMDNDVLFKALIASQESLPIEDTDSLEDSILDARRSVRQQIQRYVNETNNYIKGDLVRGNKNELNVGPGGVASGVVQQNAGRDAKAEVNSEVTQLSPEVKQLFDTLQKQINDATTAAGASPADKAIVQQKLDEFQAQVKKGKENRKWYEVSAKGLLDAVGAVGAIVAPIGAIVAKIVAMVA